MPETSRRPLLGTTYEGHDPIFLERVLPSVGYIEVTPDSVAHRREGKVSLNPATIAELRNINQKVMIGAHGVGLSIGSHEGYSREYLHLLNLFMEQLEVGWHSEHLGYVYVDGQHLGTMLALPRTRETLELVCERVAEIQEHYHQAFLLENVVHLLPDYDGDFGQAEFLNLIASRTGCGLILDVHNLECDAINYGWNPVAFMDELDFSFVHEIHLAGGVKHRGFMLDVHSRLTRPSTLELARYALTRSGGRVRVVNYELLPMAIPLLGHQAIVDELQHISRELLEVEYGTANFTEGTPGINQVAPK